MHELEGRKGQRFHWDIYRSHMPEGYRNAYNLFVKMQCAKRKSVTVVADMWESLGEDAREKWMQDYEGVAGRGRLILSNFAKKRGQAIHELLQELDLLVQK